MVLGSSEYHYYCDSCASEDPSPWIKLCCYEHTPFLAMGWAIVSISVVVIVVWHRGKRGHGRLKELCSLVAGFRSFEDVNVWFVHWAMCLILLLYFRTASCVLRIVLFSVCCGVALVPQALLEFRYYTVPFLFLRLHLAPHTPLAAVAELVLYSSVNMVTLWLFLYRPFLWPNEENWQRFMW